MKITKLYGVWVGGKFSSKKKMILKRTFSTRKEAEAYEKSMHKKGLMASAGLQYDEEYHTMRTYYRDSPSKRHS